MQTAESFGFTSIPPAPYCSPAEEVPSEGHTDSRFSVKCRWYRSVVTKGGQVRAATQSLFAPALHHHLLRIIVEKPQQQMAVVAGYPNA